MTFEQFREIYLATFRKAMSYAPTECGAGIYAEHLAELADKYPEFAKRCEADETI